MVSVRFSMIWGSATVRRLLPLVVVAACGAAAQNVSLSMSAVSATHEGRDEIHIDKGLEPVRESLATIKQFDTFRLIKSATTTTRLESEAAVTITPEYTLYCTPHSKDESGRILTSIRIEMTPDEKDAKPVNVVKLSIRAVPGDKINILGPKLDEANLIVVLTVGQKP